MSKNLNFEEVDEMAVNAEFDENLEGAVEEKNSVNEVKWYNKNGEEVSKSAFIREKFIEDNMSRKEIAEKFNIPYRTVYGATVNLENSAEPTSRGRGTTFSKLQVTADGVVVMVKDDTVFFDNVAQPEGTVVPETIEVDRNTFIKEQVANGRSRGEIAKALDLSYGVIYGLTKDAESARQKYEIEDPETGEIISRNEYIRRRVAAGVSKSDVAKELGVEYSVVWQATKKQKSEQERFEDAIEVLRKFENIVSNPDALQEAIGILQNLEIEEKQEEEVETEK